MGPCLSLAILVRLSSGHTVEPTRFLHSLEFDFLEPRGTWPEGTPSSFLQRLPTTPCLLDPGRARGPDLSEMWVFTVSLDSVSLPRISNTSPCCPSQPKAISFPCKEPSSIPTEGALESECHPDGNSLLGTEILVQRHCLTCEETEAERRVAAWRWHGISREGGH